MNRTTGTVLLICLLLAGISGCTSPSQEKPVPASPVFSNGSAVTDGPWISMNPIGDHKKGETFAINGSTSLPVKTIIEVIIVQPGPAAARITSVDDCITEKQKCVLYFAKAAGNGTAMNHWSVTTDDSMDVFRSVSPGRYTVIVKNTGGNLSARSAFSLT